MRTRPALRRALALSAFLCIVGALAPVASPAALRRPAHFVALKPAVVVVDGSWTVEFSCDTTSEAGAFAISLWRGNTPVLSAMAGWGRERDTLVRASSPGSTLEVYRGRSPARNSIVVQSDSGTLRFGRYVLRAGAAVWGSAGACEVRVGGRRMRLTEQALRGSAVASMSDFGSGTSANVISGMGGISVAQGSEARLGVSGYTHVMFVPPEDLGLSNWSVRGPEGQRATERGDTSSLRARAANGASRLAAGFCSTTIRSCGS